MIFHPKHILLLLAFTATFSMAANEPPFGCLIHEAYGPDTYTLTDGAVSQSFKPCSTGELVYIHLFLNSAENNTFSALMNITALVEGKTEVLAKQQIIVPENTKDPFVSIPLASSVHLEEGKEYWINVEANNQHPLNISYSAQNDYNDGSAFRNGTKTRGDLAFELGIRFTEDQAKPKSFFQISSEPSNCLKKVSEGKVAMEADFENWNLKWIPCQNTSLNSVALQVISNFDVHGIFTVQQNIRDRQFETVYSQEIRLTQVKENWQLINLEESFELEEGIEYDLEFQPFDTWETKFIGNPKSLRESKYNYWINPVQFNSWDDSRNNDYTCSTWTSKVNGLHESQNEMLVQTFTSCTDGYLTEISVAAIMAKGQTTDWFIRDQNELILDQGTAKCKHGQLIIATDLEVLKNTKYDLVLLSTPEAKSTFYLAETDQNIQKATSDLMTIDQALLIHFDFEELEIELLAKGESKPANLAVYPNPFTDGFQVNIDGIDGIDEECTLTLYDFSGNEVWVCQLQGTSSIEVQANIDSGLPKGYYTLRLDYGNSVLLETLIKN